MRKPINFISAAALAAAPSLIHHPMRFARPLEPRQPESSYTPEQKATKAAEMERLKAESPGLNRSQRKRAARRVAMG